MGTKVNKVGQTDAKTAEKNKKDKDRIAFIIADALYRNGEGNVVSAVNADGLLIAVPRPLKEGEGKDVKVIYAGFSNRKHLPLKKTDFAGIVEHMRYTAFVARAKALVLIRSAEDKEKKADRISQYGDDATRKKVQKAARLREQLALMEKQLTEEGVDITKI